MRTHYIATETLYMTADRRRVVREGDPAAAMPGASRLVTEGFTLPASTVERFGLRTVGDLIVGIIRDAVETVVTDILTDAANAVIDTVADALNTNDDGGDDAPPVPAGDVSDDSPTADVQTSDDAPAPETASDAIRDAVETKPITPKRRRR